MWDPQSSHESDLWSLLPPHEELAPLLLYVVIALYFMVSLTIPFWVPILKRTLGECGVFWVFSTLTYYAYLAWVLFAVLLAFTLHRSPLLGSIWLLAVVWRVASFVRLGSRAPPPPTFNLEAGGGAGPEGSPLGRVLLVGNGPSIRGSVQGQVPRGPAPAFLALPCTAPGAARHLASGAAAGYRRL